MKKFMILILGILGILFVLSAIFFSKIHNDYNDPEYQAYKSKYFQCVDTDKNLTPDFQIYKAWKNNETINC